MFKSTFGLVYEPEQMAHLVEEAKIEPLPSGEDPRPDEEADEDETRSALPFPVRVRPDSEALRSPPTPEVDSEPFVKPPLLPLASTIPVRLSKLGVGEVELTCKSWWCCMVVAMVQGSECLQFGKQFECFKRKKLKG